jgi:hypothetical protein
MTGVLGDHMTLMALRSAAAGAVALAFGGAPLGVLMIARRLSLMGDALSHGILPGVAIAFLLAGRDPVALTLGALAAGLIVAGLSSLLARTGKLPDDAASPFSTCPRWRSASSCSARWAGPTRWRPCCSARPRPSTPRDSSWPAPRPAPP